jgi:cysteine desulfurase
MIYLDHNATTAVLPEVADAMWPYLTEQWGNPSGGYPFGATSKAAIEMARGSVAALIGALPEEITFTSGATEANNTAIHTALSTQPTKPHLITSRAEHSSVLAYCEMMKDRGVEITYLNVDANGQLDLEELTGSIRPDTALVSIMWANNETGVLSPVKEIAAACHKKGVRFHCDAVQAVGKVSVDFARLPIDYLTLSGHKLGAPKGIGALVTRSGTPFLPLLVGGKQESGRRGGTESVPLIVALGTACSIAARREPNDWAQIARLRDDLESRLFSSFPDAYLNSTKGNRLPNTSNFGFPGIDSDALVAYLGSQDICVSSGSACMESSLAPSHVIMAMRQNHQQAGEALRISLGLMTTEGEITRLVELLEAFVPTVR